MCVKREEPDSSGLSVSQTVKTQALNNVPYDVCSQRKLGSAYTSAINVCILND